MASKSKCIQIANNVDPLAKSNPVQIPSDVSQLPSDYPFGDRLFESLADYAHRVGKKVNTIRKQADRGRLITRRLGKGRHREVNLYAIYLEARTQAEHHVAKTCCQPIK